MLSLMLLYCHVTELGNASLANNPVPCTTMCYACLTMRVAFLCGVRDCERERFVSQTLRKCDWARTLITCPYPKTPFARILACIRGGTAPSQRDAETHG